MVKNKTVHITKVQIIEEKIDLNNIKKIKKPLCFKGHSTKEKDNHRMGKIFAKQNVSDKKI